MYNLLVGGAAGQGVETTSAILEKLLKRSGYSVFTMRDFMSRIRGGHNFSQIRFGTQQLFSHSDQLDGIIAMNDETVEWHLHRLKPEGFILGDSLLATEDPRAVKIGLDAMAKAAGNVRASGSAAIGAVLKIFGESTAGAAAVLRAFVKEPYLDANLEALAAGYQAVESRYPHLEGEFAGWMILPGSKALALGALAAGLRFYSAYPMSPATPILEYLAQNARDAGLVVEQAEDEIAAVNMALGASYAGVRAMTGTSGGGFSLMVEALGLSGMAEIPLVIVDMQRPGPVTGLPTRTEQGDLKFVISASQGEFPRLVIALRHHADAFAQTARAFNLAEKYQIPVIILSDQYLSDASATVEPFDIASAEIESNAATKADAGEQTDAAEREEAGEYLRYRLTEDGISPQLVPGKTEHLVRIDSDEHDERGWITESAAMRVQMVDKRLRKLVKLEQELQEPAFIGPPDFITLLLGWGSTYGPIAEAIDLLNAKANVGKSAGHAGPYAALVFGDIFPLPQKMLQEKAALAKRIVNVEQNATGQLAGLIREQTGIACGTSVLKYDGRQISGEEIARKLAGARAAATM
jgi:2-oxoglutarate ferredoxin oxidoreductase subunit alpha